jgi:hypothetical protein
MGPDELLRGITEEGTQADGRDDKSRIAAVADERRVKCVKKNAGGGGCGMLVHDRKSQRFPKRAFRFRRLSRCIKPLGDRQAGMIAGTSGRGEEKFPTCTEKPQLVDRREKVGRCDTPKEMEWRRKQRKTQRAEAAHGMVEGKRQGRLDGDMMAGADRCKKLHRPLVPGDKNMLSVVDHIARRLIDE